MIKILFVCTHNRCRSILAEACANYHSEGMINAASGGSEPAGEIHPKTLEALARQQIPVEGLKSQSWDELEEFGADFVITVCDNAAQEKCPLWFGSALNVHWSLTDPSSGNIGTKESEDAFDNTIALIIRRIEVLTLLLKKDPGRTEVLDLLNSLAGKN